MISWHDSTGLCPVDLVVPLGEVRGDHRKGGMSMLGSLGAGWPIPPLDRGVTMRALQTPIWWPLHWFSTPVC